MKKKNEENENQKKTEKTKSIDNTQALSSRRTWSLCGRLKPVRVAGTDSSADLGGSSKYSNVNFED